MDYLTHKWPNMVLLFYTTYISVDLAHHMVICYKAGKGGVIAVIQTFLAACKGV